MFLKLLHCPNTHTCHLFTWPLDYLFEVFPVFGLVFEWAWWPQVCVELFMTWWLCFPILILENPSTARFWCLSYLPWSLHWWADELNQVCLIRETSQMCSVGLLQDQDWEPLPYGTLMCLKRFLISNYQYFTYCTLDSFPWPLVRSRQKVWRFIPKHDAWWDTLSFV